MTKILIVEDEAGLRQGLEINLRHENYETVTAGDSAAGIRPFHAESTGLIRVDLNLNSRTVDTHVTRLRRKLQKAIGTDAAVIVAVAKIGYRYLGQATA